MCKPERNPEDNTSSATLTDGPLGNSLGNCGQEEEGIRLLRIRHDHGRKNRDTTQKRQMAVTTIESNACAVDKVQLTYPDSQGHKLLRILESCKGYDDKYEPCEGYDTG